MMLSLPKKFAFWGGRINRTVRECPQPRSLCLGVVKVNRLPGNSSRRVGRCAIGVIASEAWRSSISAAANRSEAGAIPATQAAMEALDRHGALWAPRDDDALLPLAGWHQSTRNTGWSAD
jgi:hypothetical protein